MLQDVTWGAVGKEMKRKEKKRKLNYWPEDDWRRRVRNKMTSFGGFWIG